jgi:hypothetical protein
VKYVEQFAVIESYLREHFERIDKGPIRPASGRFFAVYVEGRPRYLTVYTKSLDTPELNEPGGLIRYLRDYDLAALLRQSNQELSLLRKPE